MGACEILFLSVFAITAFMLTSCSEENVFLNEPVNDRDEVLSRTSEETLSESYVVTPEMVCKYLNIARRGKTLNSLTPAIENGDTLAYVAQYANNQGWDLISGDSRIAPVLANSETGVLNLSDTTNPAVGAVKGMIRIVKETKEKNDTLKNDIWKFLEPKDVNSINKPQSRGIGFGKWIAQDTIYESDNYTRPHIITTKWGQDFPWNLKTPRLNGQATKVGCVPVAAGQIIYHFRRNNHRDIALPQTAIFTDYYYDMLTGTPSFYNYSTGVWSDFKLNAQTACNEDDITVIFLSYLGEQIGMQYGIESSVPLSDNIKNILLNNYGIESTRTSTYDFNQILSNLENGKPIYACFNGPQGGHAFIIDAYKYDYERMYVRYMWDPNYELQEGDEVVDPPMDAIDSKDGYAWREEDISIQESCRLMMNWGWDGSSDNISYLAYTLTRWAMEESPIIRYYDPSWTANGSTYSELDFLLYNLCESE